MIKQNKHNNNKTHKCWVSGTSNNTIVRSSIKKEQNFFFITKLH